MANTIKAKEQEKKWQAESDLSTLIEAEKIRGNKPRLKAAMSCRSERMKALEEVGEPNQSKSEEKGENY